MIYGNEYVLVANESFIESGFFDEIDKWKAANPDSGRKFYKNDVVTDAEYEKLSKDIEILRNSENYEEYKKAFARLCYFCHIVPRGVVIANYDLKKGKKEDRNSLHIEYTYSVKRMKLPEGAILYHMSNVGGIKALLPFFSGRGKTPKGYLFQTPRVYFTLKKNMPKIWADHRKNEKMHMYVCKEKINYVYVDPMLWGPASGAVYVETSKPIDVDELDTEDDAKEVKKNNDEALEESAFNFDDFFSFVTENGLTLSE